jgi:hypothetical protein
VGVRANAQKRIPALAGQGPLFIGSAPSIGGEWLSLGRLDRSFACLIAYNLDKHQFRAILGLEAGSDLAVLAQYEFHGTHPGWHVLAACGDVVSVPRGMMRGPWQRRLPSARGHHADKSYKITDDNMALGVAAEFFKLHKTEGSLV